MTEKERLENNAKAKRYRDRKAGLDAPKRRSGPRDRNPIKVGEMLGLLKAIKMVSEPHGAEYWLCECQCGCGTERTTTATYLRMGRVTSCHTRTLTKEQRKRRATQPRPCRTCKNIFSPKEFLGIWCHDCKDCRGLTRIKISVRKLYGMTMEQYLELVRTQQNKCAICGNPPKKDGRIRRLHIDHDHETNVVRGLLCTKCNSGIGYLKDSLELVEKAAAYLRKYLTS